MESLNNNVEIDNDFNFENNFFTEKEINEKRLELLDIKKENKIKFSIDKKKLKRQQTKQKRKENRKKINEENKKYVSLLTNEEKVNYYTNKENIEKEKENNLKNGLQSNYIIAFDLDYSNYMKIKEIKSLSTQLSYAYSLNKSLKNPLLYYFCNYEGEIKEEMELMGSNYWHAKFFSNNISQIDEITKSGKEIIYLSPDSENILTEINNNTIYIIGGFVDKPVNKNKSLYKAYEYNYKNAKLPLLQYSDDIMNHILNVNTVVEIIGYYLEFQNWGDAINKAIPKRKKNK